MTKILIVEDSKSDYEKLKKYTEIYVASENIFHVENGKDAFRLICTHKFDVVFIDIALPDMNGFELARKINEYDELQLTSIVFVTGTVNDARTIQRRHHNYDYIEKPYNLEQYKQAMSSFFTSHEKRNTKLVEKQKKIIELPIERGTSYKVDFDSILFAEKDNRTIKILLDTEKELHTSLTLKEFVDYVDDDLFIRCHKSYAVNISNVISIEPSRRYLWKLSFLSSDKKCELSRHHYKEFCEKWKIE